MTLKKFCFTACIIALAYCYMELCSLFVYYSFYRVPFSFSAIGQQRSEAYTASQSIDLHNHLDATRNLAPHPFVGYVLNMRPNHQPYPHETPYGFSGYHDPIAASADPHTAIIAITGGSVANRFYLHARAFLHKYLDGIPLFRDRKVMIISLGQEAYAEPQQMFSVAYYLMQGGRLDMLINLDGYNEAVMGFDQQRHHAYPAYPGYWTLLFSDHYTTPDAEILSNIAMWKHFRHIAASAAGYARFSVTAQTLWSLVDLYCHKRSVDAELELRDNPGRLPYFMTGPDTMQDASPRKMADFEMRFWEQGSIGMWHLAQDHGFRYFHFIQPCQYIAGSKPLTNEEEAKTYNPKWSRAIDYVRMYPRLLEGLRELRRKGIDVYDLTDIYKNVGDTVYHDANCHLNKLGNELMAQAISRHIIDSLNHPAPVKSAR